MPSINAQIGLGGAKFAKRVIDKYIAFPARKHLISSGKKISNFMGKLNLVYSFSRILIKWNTLRFEQTRTMVLTKKLPFLSQNKIALERAYRYPEQILRHKQATTPSHQAGPREFSLLSHVHAAPFLGAYPLSEALQSYALWQKETGLPHERLSDKDILEKQARWFSERVLQRGQRTGFFQQQKSVQYLNQRIFEAIIGRGIHAKEDVETPLHATQQKPRASLYEYAPSEHVIRSYPQIIKETREKIVEKESAPVQQANPSALDVSRLADQIYQLIERKIRIERERRGL
jgi:hypothetical protein